MPSLLASSAPAHCSTSSCRKRPAFVHPTSSSPVVFRSSHRPCHSSSHRQACSTLVRSTSAQEPKPYATRKVPIPYADVKPIAERSFEGCAAPEVHVDNSSDEHYTVLTVEVMDYQGLLRTVSWVLHGLGTRVQHARLHTEDGIAKDVLYLTDMNNKKLSDKFAAAVEERVQDFVLYCSPGSQAPCEEWAYHNMTVSNVAHPQYTVLTVLGEPKGVAGYLLELSSVLTGLGLLVHEGVVQGGPAQPQGLPPVAPPGHDYGKLGRAFRFWISDKSGQKLESSRVSALLYTLELVSGKKYMPTVAPNMGTMLRRAHKAAASAHGVEGSGAAAVDSSAACGKA